MYLNVLSFKNGKTLSFQTIEPFTPTQVNQGWTEVKDAKEKQTVYFDAFELVTIATVKVAK